MADVFKDILIRGLRERQIPNKTREARQWYRNQAASFFTTPSRVMLESPLNDLKRMPQIGNMYMYWYDPKWKDILPLYDKFPCTIVFKLYEDGFLGLNLHYLKLPVRAAFMDQLYQYTNDNTNYDEKTRFMLTYNLMKHTASLDAFRPCIKRYLTNHVRSRFLKIPPVNWDTALFLPVEQWNDPNESRNQLMRPYKSSRKKPRTTRKR